MQLELRQIQREVGITFVFVTHDQHEALTMSDRIAVFNAGRVEQVGTPAEVYERPATPFVAGFVGTSNLLAGEAARAVLGRDGAFGIRPEKIRLADPDAEPGPAEDTALGTVREAVYSGPATLFVVELDAGSRLTALQQNQHASGPDADSWRGRRIRLLWHRQHNFPVGGAPDGSGVDSQGEPG